MSYPGLGSAALEALRERRSSLPGLWRFKALLPTSDRTPLVSLGEGGTPLQDCDRLRSMIGVQRLLIKNETVNPSGTFKDRCMAVGVAKALEYGASAAVIASAGNAGASAAAYCARSGLPLLVFVPTHTPRERITQILLYGGRAIAAGRSVNEATALIEQASRRHGWHVLTTANPCNPYQGEGAKTVGFEIAEQLELDLPDWVIVPVGGGGLLGAVWKAFRELRTAGLVSKLPRMVGVQAEGCAPLVRAFEQGVPSDAIAPWNEPSTVAASIADPFPMDGYLALEAVRESGGLAVAVPDGEILDAEGMLARYEGVFAEPGSSSTLAALRRLRGQGVIADEARVLLIVTGIGFKDMNSAERLAPPPVEIECTVDALESVVEGLSV